MQNIKPKYIFIISVVLTVLITLGYFVYRYAQNGFKIFSFSQPKVSIEEEKKNFMDAYNPSSENVVVGSLSDVIKNELSLRYSRSYSEITITSLQGDENYSRAVVDTRNVDLGPVTVLLENEDGKWSMIYSGTDKIPCQIVNDVSFSKAMVPVCVDSEGKYQSRTGI